MIETFKYWFVRDISRIRCNVWVWVSVFVCLALKSVLFHKECFGTILVSTFWYDQIEFWRFYLPKLAGAALFSSFVFLFRRKVSVFILLLLLDLWIEANLVYVRSYDSFLDVYAITMVGNMKGFWDSVFLYIYPKDLKYLLLSCMLLLVLLFFQKGKHSILGFAISLLIFGLLDFSGWFLYNVKYPSSEGLKSCFPYNFDTRNKAFGSYGVKAYMQITSIFQFPLYILSDFIQMDDDLYGASFSSNEIEWLNNHQDDRENSTFSSPLIIILVESFENWVITPEITPNLYGYLKDNPVFYANKITSEIKEGGSADGQMIVNTGLLPLQYGAACFRYPHNVYPGIMKLSANPSICILPHETNIWNQEAMSIAYGYDSTYVSVDDDRVLFQDVLTKVKEGWRSIQVVTMSTHVPFSGAKFSNFDTPSDMPKYLADYIKAFSNFDESLSVLLSSIEKDPILQLSTIVITGDHKIFPSDLRDDYRRYMENHEYDLDVSQPYCPLIIISPDIKEDEYVTDICYQMDIYPTILQSIGCRGGWNGLGIGLRGGYCPDKRKLTEDKAFELSDKIIRNNYFAK